MEELQKRLQELRKEKGITQKAAAVDLNVSRETISGYETKGREPDINMLMRLANYYNVTIDYLVGRADERTNEK